jgi:L-asparaginase II
MNPTLVDVLRGQAVESSHRGALAVVDAEGACVTSLGEARGQVSILIA